MSWFSGLAGRAEAFLDKMDQTAATTLNDVGITPQKKPHHDKLYSPDDVKNKSLPYEPTTTSSSISTMDSGTSQGSTVAQILVGSASGAQLLMKSKQTTSPSTTTTSSNRAVMSGGGGGSQEKPHSPGGSNVYTPKENDDMLFEFLNTPSSKTKPKTVSSRPSSGSRTSTRSVTPLNIRLSQQPSLPRPHSSPVMLQPSLSKSKLNEMKSARASTEETEVIGDDSHGVGGGWKIGGETESENIDIETDLRGSKRSSVVDETDSHSQQLAVIQESTDPPSSEQALLIQSSETQVETTAAEDETSPSKEGQEPATSDEETPVLHTEGAQTHAVLDALNQKVSTLELENKLLKREVGSLNDELGSVLSRTKEASDNISHYESEIHALREQALQTDHMIRQLRSHEEDLQATIDSKESQIQVLRTRFTEAERMMEDLKHQLSSSQKEKERFLQDANLSSDAQNHALESLKVKLSQTESSLQEEREKMDAAKWEHMKRESELQSEHAQLTEALSSQQRQLSLQQSKTAECQAALQSAHNELRHLRKEHEEYKQRATGILQAKEKLITTLQSEGGGAVGGAASEAKLEEVRLEKEHLQAQLMSARQQIDAFRTDIQEMEERHHGEVEELTEQVRVCEEVLGEEKKQHKTTQESLVQLKQELEMHRDEVTREKTELMEQVKSKESENVVLQTKLTSSLGSGKAELESRLHDLTESLIQKQTTLETLNTEKHSLRLQLQRLEAQLTEAQRMQPTKAQTTVVMNGLEQSDNQSESPRIRPIASVLPPIEQASSDSRLHNIKRAVNTVDRFSIRMGVFLRRYPHARLFALLYMVLLHIWVMIVLLTYTPEAHGVDGANLHTAM